MVDLTKEHICIIVMIVFFYKNNLDLRDFLKFTLNHTQTTLTLDSIFYTTYRPV